MFASLFVSACDQKEEDKGIDGDQGINPELLSFRFETKEPELNPEPELEYAVDEVTLDDEAKEFLHYDFGSVEDIEKRISVESLRQKRAKGGAMILSAKSRIRSELEEYQAPQYRLKDKDYSRDNTAQNISTLPVDRFRVITTDKKIPGILEDSINSKIPDVFTVAVERHVFGSDGRAPLLPKGTKIMCKYESLSRVGDSRLVATCSRALRPDGAQIMLSDAASVGDLSGKRGLVGEVDNKNFERYAGAFGVSLISAATAGVVSMDNSTFAKTASISAALSAGQLSARILDENIDIEPVMTVAAGSKIVIKPLTDIWIRKPELLQGDHDEFNEETTGGKNEKK
jgi:type IV secretory pathway VirB10-like protein